MKRAICYLFGCFGLLISCNNAEVPQHAVAAWSFADINDQAGLNSTLREQGTVQWVSLTGDDKPALQGRMKPDSLNEYNPFNS